MMLSDEWESDRNNIERVFGQRLVRLATAWRREIDHDLRPFALTDATWRTIYYLTTLPQPVRQTDLARALSIEAPSLARLLDVLEQRGLVLRTAGTGDRRSKHITLTQAGQSLAGTVTSAARNVAARLLAGVSTDELRHCHAIFDQIDAAARHDRQDERLAESEHGDGTGGGS